MLSEHMLSAGHNRTICGFLDAHTVYFVLWVTYHMCMSPVCAIFKYLGPDRIFWAGLSP